MSLYGKQIIASEFRSTGEQRFAAVNPATGIALEPQFCEATPEDVNNATTAAAAAFDLYRKLPSLQRAAFLESIGIG